MIRSMRLVMELLYSFRFAIAETQGGRLWDIQAKFLGTGIRAKRNGRRLVMAVNRLRYARQFRTGLLMMSRPRVRTRLTVDFLQRTIDHALRPQIPDNL